MHGPWVPLRFHVGVPGEGPSHSPYTRRDTRPSLRVWSTKRPGTAQVDPVRIKLDFEPISTISKLTHDSNETRLGRWLFASRLADSDSGPPRPASGGDPTLGHTQALTPAAARSIRQPKHSIPQTHTMRQDDSHIPMDMASGRPEGHTGFRTVPFPRQPPLPHVSPRDSHDNVVEPLSSRQDFIREFALLRGVSRSALDAIWRSNKRGYNTAQDAHFDRFCLFFRETKPTCRFALLKRL